MRKILIAFALSVLSFQAAASTSFTLSSCNMAVGAYSWAGPSPIGFDEAICSFSSTTTSSLDVSAFGSGMIDPSAHGAYGVAIDLFDGSTWVNIFTSPTFGSDTSLSSILAGPIDFAALTADQLRLRSDIDHGWNFHNASGDMTFTLNDATVPEPTSIALLGLGLAGFGFGRRKSKKAA